MVKSGLLMVNVKADLDPHGQLCKQHSSLECSRLQNEVEMQVGRVGVTCRRLVPSQGMKEIACFSLVQLFGIGIQRPHRSFFLCSTSQYYNSFCSTLQYYKATPPG